MMKLSALVQLSRNDLKAKYANSVLGIVWAFVMPLITILVFWYVFQLGFKNLPVGNAPYILWFSSAYVPWIFFVDLTTAGCNSLVEYSFLVKKIKFDINYIPFMKITSSLTVHIFFVLFLLFMHHIYGFEFNGYSVQIIYYSICICTIGLALTWLLSAINVFFKDLNSLYNVLIQIGFWITPILWNEETMVDKTVRKVLAFNPMHYIVNGYRDSLLNETWFWEKPTETILFWSTTGILLVFGHIVFRRLSPYFADEV